MPTTSIRSYPPKNITNGLSVVPNSPTDLATTDSVIFQIVVANTTGGAVTFTVTDKAASAKTLIPTVSLAANSVTIWHFPEGIFMSSGISWTAGTSSALHAEVYGTYDT